MEYFGVLGFIFGLLAWFNVSALSKRVRKLEGILKEEGYVDSEKESLREILAKNIGKHIKLELSDEAADYGYAVEKKDCVLLDADEDWVKIRLNNKKQEEDLLRIDAIESVQFIES